MHSPSNEKSPIAMAAPLADSEAPAPSTTAQELAHLAREFLVVVLFAYAILSALLPALAYVLARLPAFAVPDAPPLAVPDAPLLAHVDLLRVVFVCTALVFVVYGAAVAAYFAVRTYWCARRSADLEKGSEEECASLLLRRGPIAL